VLDCDGLLLATESRWSIAERALLESEGGVWTPELKEAMLGRSLADAGLVMARALGRTADEAPRLGQAMIEGYERAVREHGVEPMPGARGFLARMDGRLPMAVASNTPERLTRAALAESGLGPFWRALVCAGDGLRPKPAPDVYLAACEALGAEPARCIAVEDSQPGADAARAAGLWTIGVPSLPGQALEADEVVASLDDLEVEALAG
jgi:HAD superfamily hydrolase (TIGR01509 family)